MNQPVPVRLVFRRKQEIRSFSGFEAFSNRYSNDCIYEFEQYFRADMGTDLWIEGAPADRWPEFVAFFLKLEAFTKAIRLLFDLFDLELVPGEFTSEQSTTFISAVDDIDTLIANNRHLTIFRHMWEQFQPSLLATISGLGSRSEWKGDELPRLNVDDIFYLEAVASPAQIEFATSFDVFISYRHAKFLSAARELAKSLTRRGFKVWLDTEEIGTRIISFTRRQLLRAIADGVRSSAVVAFFEGVATRVVDPVTEEARDNFSWQQFERKRARSVVYIYPSARLFSPSFSSKPRPYSSLEDLTEAVVMARSYAHPGPSLLPHSGEHPKLFDVKHRIEEDVTEFFGPGMALSHRVAFLLAAPTDSSAAITSSQVAFGDHVVSHALTYSPRWAHLLAHAGLDIARDIDRLRWDAWSLWGWPSYQIVQDTFGLDREGHAAALARATGRLGDDALLLALLGSGAAGGMAAERLGRLFHDSRRSGDAKTPSHRRHAQDIARLRDRVMDVLRDEASSHDGQFFLLNRATTGWSLRPIAPVTAVRLDMPGLSGTFAVCQSLGHGIFVRDRLEVLVRAMHAADANELRHALECLPDLNFLLGDTALLRRAAVHEMVSARGRPLGIFLISDRIDGASIEVMPHQAVETILHEAMVLCEQPDVAGDDAIDDGFARFFKREDVVIIGPPDFFLRTPEHPTQSLTSVVFDVISNLLAFEIAFRDELDFR